MMKTKNITTTIKVNDEVRVKALTSSSDYRYGKVCQILKNKVAVQMYDVNAINWYPIERIVINA